ncbi:MAG: phospholipid carrier-dependent glycosyltransferase [bacterium]
MDLLREPQPTSLIAQERVEPGPPGPTFVGLAMAMALGACGVAAYLGLRPGGPFPVEEATAGNPGSMYFPLGLHAARGVSAFAGGFAVAACAFAARRLWHSDAVGLLAAAILALDPGFIATARVATPEMLGIAALVGALAFLLAAAPWSHWAGAGLLALAALVDPRTVLWGLPLAAMTVLRGHIYAAPRHLGKAALQTGAAPLAGALLNLLSGAPGLALPPCQVPIGSRLLLLEAPDFGGVAAVHDPVTWFAGMGALLLLAGAALWMVLNQVRMARLPGRLQLRLSTGLPAPHGRILWLLVLALAAPFGTVWVVLFAIALAAGIGLLAEDAPGFGATVALVVLLFGVLALVRAWPMLHSMGDVGEAASGLVPWGSLTPCIG